MKTLLKTMALMLVLAGFAACTPDEDVTPQQLEVTPNNLRLRKKILSHQDRMKARNRK